MSNVNAVTFTIVVVLFLVVTLTGFAAARWRRAEDMLHLNEWGLGGRGFGTFIAWFLLGGDLYTAYTFIAVPAAMFGAGAVTGYFAVAYTIIVFPIALIFLPRLWSIARVHHYVTPADFIRGRYGSRGLALAIAFTGILALMPYIALQLVGIQAVLTVMGVGTTSGNAFVKDLPLIIAFLVLAFFTFVSGLRAPALIAFIKDTLVYLMIIVAVLYLPDQGGRLGAHLLDGRDPHEGNQPGHGQAGRVHPHHGQQPARVLHPGARLRAGPDGLPARGHRRAVHQSDGTSSSATWRCCRSTRSCSASSPCSATWRWPTR
jgi:SSS family solute:Na+ symporter